MTEQGSHSEQESDTSTSDQGPGQRGPGRFDVRALPGQRAGFTRFEIIRAAVVGVAVVAAGIVVYAQWLAAQAPPDPAAAFRATASHLLTATLVLYTPELPAGTPSLQPTLEERPTTAPSRTPTPVASRTSTPAQARSPRPGGTFTVSAPRPTAYPAPALLDPFDGVTLFGRVFFRWSWDGPPLGDSLAFELRIWSAQEEQAGRPRRGAVAPTRGTQVEVDLRYVPAIQEYGPGDYYWTVVVVEARAGGSSQVVGQWGETRRFVYR